MSRLNTRMRRWGVVLRIASRDARQSLGRTFTAVILISLPIIIAIGSLTFWDVTTSQRYQASSWLGHNSDSQAVTLRRFDNGSRPGLHRGPPRKDGVG